MKICLLILFLSLTAFAQSKTIADLQSEAKKFKDNKKYVVQYDKFEDETLVYHNGYDLISLGEKITANLQDRSNRSPALFFGCVFRFSQTELKTSPSEYLLAFRYVGGNWKFLINDKLIILIDDNERLEYSSTASQREVQRSDVSELIGYAVSPETLLKLSKAKTIEIKIGNVVRKLKPEHLVMLGNIYKLGQIPNS